MVDGIFSKRYSVSSLTEKLLRVFNADGEAIYDPIVIEYTGLTAATKPVHWYGRHVGSIEVSLTRF